jgi:hypothetical protein
VDTATLEPFAQVLELGVAKASANAEVSVGEQLGQSPGQVTEVSPQLQVPSPQWAVSTWVQLLVPLHERV